MGRCVWLALKGNFLFLVSFLKHKQFGIESFNLRIVDMVFLPTFIIFLPKRQIIQFVKCSSVIPLNLRTSSVLFFSDLHNSKNTTKRDLGKVHKH